MNGNLAAISIPIDTQSSDGNMLPNSRGQSDFEGVLEGVMMQRQQAEEPDFKQMNRLMQDDQASGHNVQGVAQAIENPLEQRVDRPSIREILTDLGNQIHDVGQTQLPTDLLKQSQLPVSNTDQLMQELLQASPVWQTALTDDNGQGLSVQASKQGVVMDPSVEKLSKEQDSKLLAELQAALGTVLPQLNQGLSMVGKSTDIDPRQAASVVLANGQQQQASESGLSSLFMQGDGVELTNGNNPSIAKALSAQIAQTMTSGHSSETTSVAGAQNAAKGQQDNQDDVMNHSSKQPFFIPGEMNKVQQFVLHAGKTVQPDVSQQIGDQVKSVISSGNLKTFLDGNMQLTVKLHPANLGSVNVTLLQTDDGLLATITTHSGATKDLVESQLSQLKHALISTGVNVQKIDVAQATQPQQSEAQQQGDNHNRQQHSSGEQQHQGNGGNENNRTWYIDGEDDEDFIAALNESLMSGSESIEY